MPLPFLRLNSSPSRYISRVRPLTLVKRTSSATAHPLQPPQKPAHDEDGWPQLAFNQAIGPENRYVVSRQLGRGVSAITWLAHDQQENSYVSLKVLNRYYTNLARYGPVWELQALRRVTSPPSNRHCLRLVSNFTFSVEGGAGEHLCLVTPILGGDLKSLLKKRGLRDGAAFPLPLAKRVLQHTLRGLAHAHSRGVIHTDLKPDNIFFDTHMSNADFDKLLAAEPPGPETPHEGPGSAQVSVPQPLPLPTLDEAMRKTFVVADFGSAQPVVGHTVDEITPVSLRAPETIIGGPWNEKVDIWAFGCLVFQFVVGSCLFRYRPFPKLNLDEPNYHLYQMLCYTCEDFSGAQLAASAFAEKFFDLTCNLKSDPHLVDYPWEKSLRGYKILEEGDVLSTGALMRRCLRLDPAQRASAAELLSDPWFDGVG
ncbi:kinase-like domain-containing protein [Amylostereum chailletii]|nr:kinase-like domain-containing protein [Amylostereum chailletii]